MSLKINLENVYIVAVFSLLLFLGIGNLWGHKLSHDFPYSYFASDAFQHQTRAEGIKDAGSYRNEPYYNVFGISNVIGYYPPVIYHLAAIISHVSGLEVYDTVYFLPFFFAAVASLIFYFIIRKFNTNVAILSMPLTVLLFYNGAYTGFTWGNWPSLLAQFFLVAFFWALVNYELNRNFILLGIFLGAVFMSHSSEAFFAGFVLIIFSFYLLFRKSLNLSIIKNFALGLILVVIISSYYLVIFRYVWMERQPYTFSVIKEWGAPSLFIADFGILLIFLGIGLISGLLLFKSKDVAPLIISSMMLVFGYSNYVGFGDRAFQLRYFWPIYLSFLLGLGIYQIAKIVYPKWSQAHSIVFATIIFVLLSFASLPLLPSYSRISNQGVMDSYHWQALDWLSRNTEKDSTIYFFYGDIYNQDAVLRNSKRAHKLVIPQDYVDAIQKREIRRFYDTESPGDGGGGAAVRKSLTKFTFKLDEREKEFSGRTDICKYNYLVFDKQASQQAFAQYNLLLASELLKKDFVKLVFENEISIVLKNNKPGEDCIEQRSI